MNLLLQFLAIALPVSTLLLVSWAAAEAIDTMSTISIKNKREMLVFSSCTGIGSVVVWGILLATEQAASVFDDKYNMLLTWALICGFFALFPLGAALGRSSEDRQIKKAAENGLTNILTAQEYLDYFKAFQQELGLPDPMNHLGENVFTVQSMYERLETFGISILYDQRKALAYYVWEQQKHKKSEQAENCRKRRMQATQETQKRMKTLVGVKKSDG